MFPEKGIVERSGGKVSLYDIFRKSEFDEMYCVADNISRDQIDDVWAEYCKRIQDMERENRKHLCRIENSLELLRDATRIKRSSIDIEVRTEEISVCLFCGHIYQNPPPSQCDCNDDKQSYVDGFAFYGKKIE